VRPRPARLHDFRLGGKDNFAADRAAGADALGVYQDMASSARAGWTPFGPGWSARRGGGRTRRKRPPARRPPGSASRASPHSQALAPYDRAATSGIERSHTYHGRSPGTVR
jgi:hypothetical protein